MSADNHWGQEAKSLPKQAGYMTAMISSQIDDQMSCKRGGSIYGANAGNCLQQFRPSQLCCSSVGHDCSRQSFGTPAIHGGRILKGILHPRALLAWRFGTLVVASFIATGALSYFARGAPRFALPGPLDNCAVVCTTIHTRCRAGHSRQSA